MKNKKKVVLVTGGAGYIGSHTCKKLSESGFYPVCFDNLVSGHRGAVQWGPLEIGDVRDKERLIAVLSAYNPVAIMHFAALIQVGESVVRPDIFYDNNVYGSYCLLEAARACNVKHMVFSSTAAVYGNPRASFLDETHPLLPINPYGQTKLMMENMIRDYARAYGLQYAILRYFNAAGADPDNNIGTAYKKDTHLIPLLMRVASGHQSAIQIYGTDYPTHDGTAVRDYVHVTDLADAHVRALKKIMTAKESLTLNLGTNHGMSVKEVITAARRVTAISIPCIEQERRAGDPPILVADAGRARHILEWKPVYSDISTIVQTAWNWKQKQVAQFILRPAHSSNFMPKRGLRTPDSISPFGSNDGVTVYNS